ncbi:MAG: TolC family protein [Pseudomonadales bacterium]|nr:TolC family protein [Pseudomonadales bacterium]
MQFFYLSWPSAVTNSISWYNACNLALVVFARIVAILATMVAASTAVYAQTMVEAPADFPSVKALSLKHNPGLKAAFHHWQSQLEQKQVAGSLPDPKLSFDYFIEEIQTRTGPQEYRLMIAQKLPWFGKLSLASDIAALKAEKAFEDLQVKRNQLALTVAKLWSQGVSTQYQINIAHEELELIKQIERIARVRYRLSKAGHPDLIRVQLKRGQLENKLDALTQKRSALSQELSALTNRNLNPNFSWPAQFSSSNPSINTQSALIDSLEKNPSLKALKLTAAMANKRVEQESLKTRPDITLKYGRMFAGDAINPAMEDSGKDPQFIGIGINVPLWGEKNAGFSARAHQAKLNVEQQIARIESSLLATANNHWSQSESLKRQINRFKTSLIPQAEAALTALLRSYQTGKVTFTDLIDSEKTLLELRRQKIQLEAKHWLTNAEINALIGEAL